MPTLAALLVQGKKLAPIVAAVKAAYASIGARVVEGGDHRVMIGAPKAGWCTITDGTRHTVDLGVAAAIAEALDTRVLAVGLRGSGSHGKAASKAFGRWPKKPPSSGKPKAITDAIGKLGKDLLPAPWQLDERPGTTLTFDLSAARLTPGPFKSNTPSELRDAEQRSQLDAIWWISNHAANGRAAEAMVALGGLRTMWGWQTALDDLMHSLHSNAVQLDAGTAGVYVAIATRALDGITSKNLGPKWLTTVGAAPWAMIRQGLALLCALVAGDAAAWTRFLAGVAEDDRERYGLYVWTKSPRAIAELPPAMRKRLETDLPARTILAWAARAPHAALDAWLSDAAQLAARLGDAPEVIDRAFAAARDDKRLAARLHDAAYRLVHGKRFEPALVLFDQLITLPPTDLAVFTNALFAVQTDNSGLRLDRERATRYLEAAAPHADANPVIHVNMACVQLELGNTEGVFAALEAAKRHKLKAELAALRDEPMFKRLREDPRFVRLVGAR